jgi:hypothetical protein
MRASAEQGKRGYMWHCSARVAATDRVLSDAEWAGITRELLDGAGIAKQSDAGGPRWMAVRHHAEDHIHIAAVFVREDTSRRFWPHHDYVKLRSAARRIEQRLGLAVTAAPDGTAAPRPSRGENEKASREGRGAGAGGAAPRRPAGRGRRKRHRPRLRDHLREPFGFLLVGVPAGRGGRPGPCGRCRARLVKSGRSARTLSMAPSPSSTNEPPEEDHYGLPESVRNERKR